MDPASLKKLASLIRYFILEITHNAGSGHPTTSFSSVELMTSLFFRYFRFDLEAPDHPGNDRLIFSKGHASALFYSLYAAAGKISEKELLTYRQFGSVLEGHPTKRFAFTEAATGSLGQGLSIGAGEAWALIKMNNDSEGIQKHDDGSVSVSRSANSLTASHLPRVYVLLGDGEVAEGSVWEAASWASHHKLYNLTAVVDVNRFGQSEETMLQHNVEIYRKRFEAFGWGAIVVDGHAWDQLDAAYQKTLIYRGGPTVIIAKTIKGKGVSYWEDQNGFHNKMLPKDELTKALATLRPKGKIPVGVVKKPENETIGVLTHAKKNAAGSLGTKVVYEPEKLVATKEAFGSAILRLAKTHPQLVVLDGDVSNSLHTGEFKKAYPDRFLQMYIAEQNMVGVATGLARRGLIPWVTTFGCFLTRAHDQIRMLPLTGANVLFNGSYVGVSLGKDGPSQMALEDIAMFRSIQDSTVLYPSDPYQTEKMVEMAMNLHGVVYLRTTREPTPILYTPNDTFSVGGSSVFHSNHGLTEQITVVGAGITLHEALKAQKQLMEEGIGVRVIDCYSVKPIDVTTLKKAAEETDAILVVEDHYPEGGLGEAVQSALSSESEIMVHQLAVTKLPMSGNADELMRFEEIDSEAIVKKVKTLLQ